MALREITHHALDVAYAPEHLIKTLVDFSDRRPLIWRETSHPEVYRLHSAANEPYYVLFEDFTHVKFHRRLLRSVVELVHGTFDGVHHVDDWVPQRLVTATGPNPLPR